MDGAGHLLPQSDANLLATGAGERMGAFLFKLALLLSPLYRIRTLSSR